METVDRKGSPVSRNALARRLVSIASIANYCRNRYISLFSILMDVQGIRSTQEFVIL